MIGTTIDDRYRVVRLLGRGGMGVVYAAEQLGLDRTVALKILEHGRADRDLLTRFRREARAASRIVHPNIVQIYDVGAADGIDYIAMEYVEGKDLGRILRDDGPLEPARAIAVTRQLLEGLYAIHQEGIVHRDIKPGNVLLTTDGETVKIMDFGIAKALDASVAITAPGHAIGTANYMAPEQVIGRDIDHRADIYSAGITLYAMLVGKEPFAGGTFERVARQQLTDAIPSLDTVRPDLPRALVAAVARAVEKSASARFDDARAFAAALDREAPPIAVASEDIRDITTTVPQRSARGPRAKAAPEQPTAGVRGDATARRRQQVALVGIGVAAVGVAVWLLWGRPRAQPPARDPIAIAADPAREAALDPPARPPDAAIASAAVDAPLVIDALAVAEPPPVIAPTDAAVLDARVATVRPRVPDAAIAITVDAAIVPPIDAAIAAVEIDAGVVAPPPRQARAPVGVRKEPRPTKCGCYTERSGYLCKDVGPQLCKCTSKDQELCSQPFTKCTGPGCTEYLSCSDPYGYIYAATSEAPCAGYPKSREVRLVQGTYQCGVCTNILQYAGDDGAPCTGFDQFSAKSETGLLKCL